MSSPSRGAPARRRARWLGSLLAGATLATTLTITTSNVPVAASSSGCGPNDKFGRMFPTLPAAPASVDALTTLGKLTTERKHLETVSSSEESQDENDLPAGYTYAGQFIDHDIVLDPRSDDLISIVDPSTLVNNRTPQLDLDSVYANGPTGSPSLYEADGYRLRLGAPLTGARTDPGARDLLRGADGVALIGDPRNDENKITASLHSIFTRFHNRIADRIRSANPSWTPAQVFEAAKKQVTWSYQWALLTDFLPTMSSASEVAKTVTRSGNTWVPTLSWYDACSGSMPLEFSVAAYRWHTMVRNDYEINDDIKDLPVFEPSFDPRKSLVGFQPSPKDFAIDWDLLFKLTDEDPQKLYKFDNSLVPSLGTLPGGAAGAGPTDLSVRNLLRARQLGLPSGQDVARVMGIAPLRDDQIIVGPALAPGAPTKALTEVSSEFAGAAPLWQYIWAESVNQKFTVKNGRIVSGSSNSLRLGPVASRIVNETFVGLLANDPNSIINNPSFTPDPALLGSDGSFGFDDIVRVGTGLPTGAKRPQYGQSAGNSVEGYGWGLAKAFDGKYTSSGSDMGYSSANNLTVDHPEWVSVDLGFHTTLGNITLYPRTDGVNAGYGYPLDFAISISADGTTWNTVASVTGAPNPGAAPQTFAFAPQTARFIRVDATKLRPNPNESNAYRLQFAEIGIGYACPAAIGGFKAEFFANPDLAGTPIACQDQRTIDYDWEYGSPLPTLPSDAFSVRWTKVEQFEGGTYRFDAASDDGHRLYIDGAVVLDNWGARNFDQPAWVTVNLSPGSHSIGYEVVDQSGRAAALLTWTRLTCPTTISGYKAEFFNNTNLSGAPGFCLDAGPSSYSWTDEAPAPTFGTNNWTVRFTKSIDVAAGTYRLTLSGDDGQRVYVDNRLVVDRWSSSGDSSKSGSVALTAGRHDIRYEYWDKSGAVKPSLDIVPVSCGATSTGFRAEYFANSSLSGTPAVCRYEHVVGADWTDTSPDPLIPTTNFSARYTKTQYFPAGKYRFTVGSDDGQRLYIDGRLVLDSWRLQLYDPKSVVVDLTAGNHTIKYEYYQFIWFAKASLGWDRLSCPASALGFKAEYFANTTFAGTPAICRDDAIVGFSWPLAPDPLLPTSNFAVRWTRNQYFAGGTYTFTVRADDGRRLYIDGRLVVDSWRSQGVTTNTVAVPLTQGTHAIRFEYYDAGGSAEPSLTWRT